MLENSCGDEAVSFTLTDANRDDRHETSGFCLNRIVDLDEYSTSG